VPPTVPSAEPRPDRRTIVAGSPAALPDDLTGVRWTDGTVECRYRLEHANGSLVAVAGEVGVVITDPAAECDTCSDACAR
jgi:hypothetical protein